MSSYLGDDQREGFVVSQSAGPAESSFLSFVSPPTRGDNDQPVSSISSNKFPTGCADRGAVTANKQHRRDGGAGGFEITLSSDHFFTSVTYRKHTPAVPKRWLCGTRIPRHGMGGGYVTAGGSLLYWTQVIVSTSTLIRGLT